MAGPVPAIHVLTRRTKDVDARHKAGHDGGETSIGNSRTLAERRRRAPSPHLKKFAARFGVGGEDSKKILVKCSPIAYVRNCPISHVPVAVCRSVGIRTRGRTAARSEIANNRCDRSSSETT